MFLHNFPCRLDRSGAPMAGNGIWLKILLTSALALTILPLSLSLLLLPLPRALTAKKKDS